MRFHEACLRLHAVGIPAAVSLIWFSRNSVETTGVVTRPPASNASYQTPSVHMTGAGPGS